MATKSKGKFVGGYTIIYDHYLDLAKEMDLDHGDVLLLAKIITLDIGLGECHISDAKLGSYLGETVRNIQKRLTRLEEKEVILRKTVTCSIDGKVISKRLIEINYDLISNAN